MNVVDWTLIAQVSVAVTAGMQLLKTKKPFNAIDGEYLAMALGVFIALYFCLMNNYSNWEWGQWVQCAISGLVAGVTSSTAYNVQKAIPVAHVLPSRTQRREHLP